MGVAAGVGITTTDTRACHFLAGYSVVVVRIARILGSVDGN